MYCSREFQPSTRGSPSFQSCLTVDSLASSCITSGSVHPDWGRIRQPSCLHTDKRWIGLSSWKFSEGLVITLPFSFCRKPVKPGLNWSVSSSRRHRNRLKNVSTSKPNRPGSMPGGGHRWSTKLMPLYKRCCPRQVQWRLLSCCPGAFLQWCPSAI